MRGRFARAAPACHSGPSPLRLSWSALCRCHLFFWPVFVVRVRVLLLPFLVSPLLCGPCLVASSSGSQRHSLPRWPPSRTRSRMACRPSWRCSGRGGSAFCRGAHPSHRAPAAPLALALAPSEICSQPPSWLLCPQSESHPVATPERSAFHRCSGSSASAFGLVEPRATAADPSAPAVRPASQRRGG